MTEAEAREWLEAHAVPRGTIDRIAMFVELVIAENASQNLIAASTIETIWHRHIIDSAQLLELVPPAGRWLDLGSGAGFPGMIIALIGRHPVTMIEARSKRVAFLQMAADRLGLTDAVTIVQAKVEAFAAESFDIISARAFAPLDRLWQTARHLGGPHTRWVLPKGRNAKAELETAALSWQGDIRTVASITDSEASIILADGVHARRRVRNMGGRT